MKFSYSLEFQKKVYTPGVLSHKNSMVGLAPIPQIPQKKRKNRFKESQIEVEDESN